MYLLTSDPSPNFGTGLVQRLRGGRGLGGRGLGNYLVTSDPSPNYGTGLVQRLQGLGCNEDGCGGCGLGLFEGGMDLNTWGPMEWSLVGLVAVGAISVFNSGKRGVSSVRKSIRRRKATSARKRELQSELKAL